MTKTGAPSVESILNTVIDGIIAIDENGIMRSVNPAVQKIFGYAPDELVGKNVTMLMPQPYASEHDGYIRNYLKTGKAKIIGIGREIIGKKKGGVLFPIYLGVSEGRRHGGKRFFTGVIRDITEVKRYQDDLKRQSEFTSAVLDTVRSLVMVLDREGHVINFNRACEEATGYVFEEVANRLFWEFFLEGGKKDPVVKNFLPEDARHQANNFETSWLTKKDGKRLTAWSCAPLPSGSGGPEYVICSGIDITERRNLEKLVLEITRKEQQRLGQELHDGLAQHLASTAIAAKVLEKKFEKKSYSGTKGLKRVVAMLNQAVLQTREIAQGLYALEMRSEDLVTALKNLAHDTLKTSGVRCVFTVSRSARIPSVPAGTHLYRIAREAVANAVKHGQCRSVRMSLAPKKPGFQELKIESDGRAFPKSAKKGGLGLHMMRSRAAILGGSLEITAGLRGGAVVSCIFPENA